MDGMRRPWARLVFFSQVLAVLLVLSTSWSLANAASDRDDRIRTVNSATLHKRVGEVLVFMVDRGGRISTLKCKLADEMQILSENKEDLASEALEVGSVWVIKIEYPIEEGSLPLVLEMKRIRPRAPE